MIPRHKRMSRALWRAILLALLGALAPATASASLPSWRDSRLLDAELRRETPLPASSEIKAAAPHVHGVFCPHALPKTRVRGFELGLHCSIGGEAGLTCTSRPAYALRYGGHASERSVFTGYLWDKETNLFFAKARFYDPEVGRFTSQDSFLGQVDNPPSLHRYFYAADNPTRYVDPDGHDFKLNKDQKYGPNEVAAPVLSGKVSDGDLKQYLAYVEKHGSREDVIQATLGATGVYSKSYGQGVAKLEVAAIAGTVAGAPVAIGGGSAALVGAVGGGTQGFASGLLDNASAAEIALRTVGGAALGSAIGWVAQRLGAVTWGEASPSAPGATKTSTVVAKPASGEPEPRAPLLSDEALARGMSGGSQGADALASSQKAANTARRTSGKIEVLADAGPEGAHTSKLNAQIAEIRGYQAALENDHIGIQGTGKTDAGGVDYITLDQEGRIVAWDAKYRGPGYRHPSTLPADKLQRWMPEIQEAVEAMPDGPAKVAAQKALEAGQVVGRIFKWPPQ